jgi:hypothetical protein
MLYFLFSYTFVGLMFHSVQVNFKHKHHAFNVSKKNQILSVAKSEA